MNRKPRIQPSLAPLAPAERDQLADWLRKETYEDVLERVRKPRDQGGFGLAISIRPLQIFREKVLILDGINARLPHDKRLTMAEFEAINSGAIPVPHAGNSDLSLNPGVPPNVQHAILETTYDIVIGGGNTPANLLTLQRLPISKPVQNIAPTKLRWPAIASRSRRNATTSHDAFKNSANTPPAYVVEQLLLGKKCLQAME